MQLWHTQLTTMTRQDEKQRAASPVQNMSIFLLTYLYACQVHVCVCVRLLLLFMTTFHKAVPSVFAHDCSVQSVALLY